MKYDLFSKLFLINITLFFSLHSFAEIVFEQQPMYGKTNNGEASSFNDQDINLIANAVQTFGTREHASEGYTEKGFDHYLNKEFNKSMNRFNQAWLLNPGNPYPYLGFALLMKESKQTCEAYEMFKIANEKGLEENGFLADYAYTTSQCAVLKEKTEQENLFKLSNQLHEKATQTQDKRLLAYVYHSWAKSFFLQNDIEKTNEMIDASKSLGGKIDTSLLNDVKKHQ